MFTDVIKKSALQRYKDLSNKATRFGFSVNKYEKMSASQLREEELRLDRAIKESSFKHAFSTELSESHSKLLLKKSSVIALREFKEERDNNTPIFEGLAYYSTKVKDGRIVGKKSVVKEGRAFWLPLNEDIAIEKAKLLMKYGVDDDFRKIYFEMSDGVGVDAISSFDMRNITESSASAKKVIEAYCDDRWEGAWPWETYVPKKLKELVKETEDMSLSKFRKDFEEFEAMLVEGEMEKADIMTQLKGFSEKLDSNIEALGRMSGQLMTGLRDDIRTEYGDQAITDMESSVNDKIKSATDSLSDLKAVIYDQIEKLNGGGEEDPNALVDFDADPEAETDDVIDFDADPEAEDLEDIDMDDIENMELDDPSDEREKK